MSDLRGASSVIAVNITDIIARLRAKARAAGIDLSQPFFFPPRAREVLPDHHRIQTGARGADRALAPKQKQVTAPPNSDEPSGHKGSCEVERCSNSPSNINPSS